MCGALLALPLSAILVPPEVPPGFRLLVAGVSVTAMLSPVGALALLAMLGPVMIPVLAGLGPAPFGGSQALEAVVVAALTGISWRWAILGPLPAGRLTPPALALGVVIAASVVTQLSVDHFVALSTASFLADAWTHATRMYFLEPGSFPAWHAGSVWLEGLLLAVVIERVVGHTPGVGRLLALLVGVSLACEAAFSWQRLWEIAGRSPDQLAAAWHHALSTRISPHLPDLNAIGSLFAAGVVAWAVWLIAPGIPRGRRAAAAVAGGILAGALWLSQSRSAMAAAALLLCVEWWRLRRPSRTIVLRALAVVGVAAVLAVTLLPVTVSRASAATALSIRLELTQVGVEMAMDNPAFGVGIGQFITRSPDYIEPGLIRRFPTAARGENAHNQIVQVLAELGVVGLGLFLWLWVMILGPPSQPQALGWRAGLMALALSALLGHPLTIPYMTLNISLLAGIVAGLAVAPGGTGSTRSWRIAWIVCAIAIASVPWRAQTLRAGTDVENLIGGATRTVGVLDGIRYRIAEPTSVWFVLARDPIVIMPLRARTASTVCQVRVTIDGHHANDLTVDADSWFRARFVMTPPEESVVSRRIELATSGDGCELLVGPVQRP